MSIKSVTACICTHNRADFLDVVLKRLETIQAPGNIEFEIMVVDNVSTDNTYSVVSKYINNDSEKFKYVYEANIGLSKARNRGLRESRSDIIAFLDDDAVPREEWLNGLIEGYLSFEDVGAVGGQVLLAFSHNHLPRWFQKPLYRYYSEIEIKEQQLLLCTGVNDYPFGANISFKRELALSKGGFDEKLGRIGKKLLSGEETNLCEAIRKEGYKILINPKSIVDHYIPPKRISIKNLCKQAWADGTIYYVWNNEGFKKLAWYQAFKGVFISFLRFSYNVLKNCHSDTDLIVIIYNFITRISISYHKWRFGKQSI